MKSKTHLYFASFLFLSVLMASSMTMAQQTQPGDACDPSQEHHYQRVAGADNAGSGYELVCNGTEWKLITQWDTGSGQSFFQVGNDTDPCDSDKTGRLRYDSGADEWQYCNGSTWGPFEHAGGSAGGTVAFSPFTDLDNLAPGTLYSSNIVQIITADGSAISVSGSGQSTSCVDLTYSSK